MKADKEYGVADVMANEDASEMEDYDTYWEDEQSHEEPTTSAGATTSLVLGVIGSLAWLVPIIGMPITVVGTVFGAINFKSKKAKGIAISGFVVNVVFLSISIAKGIVDIVKLCKKPARGCCRNK